MKAVLQPLPRRRHKQRPLQLLSTSNPNGLGLQLRYTVYETVKPVAYKLGRRGFFVFFRLIIGPRGETCQTVYFIEHSLFKCSVPRRTFRIAKLLIPYYLPDKLPVFLYFLVISHYGLFFLLQPQHTFCLLG